MKLFTILAAAVMAQEDAAEPTVGPTTPAPTTEEVDPGPPLWDGNALNQTCGQQFGGFWKETPRRESFVNKTCTISGTDIKYMYAGGGAFVTGLNTFTGYDEQSSFVDVIVFYNQAFDEEEKVGDNSTCWTASVDCVDSGAVPGVYFMETVNDYRHSKNGNYNLQISGVAAGDVLTIELLDDDGHFATQNISVDNFGTVKADTDVWGNHYNDAGSFTIEVDGHHPFGQLFQVKVTQQPGETGVLNLWKSTVSV